MIPDRIRELRRVPAGELIANPQNWRKHPKAQREAMSSLLKEIGYADALLARETEDGLMLIDGHLRKETTPDQVVPVLIVDLDDNEANLLLASHDPVAAMAKADASALEDILKNTTATEAGVDKFLAELARSNNILQNEDVEEDGPAPELQDVVTQPGDLWTLGSHRLLCGDATDPVAVEKLLGGARPFLMVTDPPYGVEYDPAWRNEVQYKAKGRKGNTKRLGKVSNDHRADWRGAWKLFPGDVAYVWHNAVLLSELSLWMSDCGFEPRNQIVWAKDSPAMSRGHYNWQHESCLYAVRQGAKVNWRGPYTESTLWEIPHTGKGNEKTIHSTQKPVACMWRPMRNHAAEEVYDPFLGSGTSIIAAEQHGISCYGLELEPGYCDIIVQRWQNYTGQRGKLARLATQNDEEMTDGTPDPQRV